MMLKFTLSAAACVIATAASSQVADTPDIARKIVDMGPDLSREMVGGTMKIYKPLAAQIDMTGIEVLKDQRYGEAERNVLDVYKPAGADGSQPIVIFAHGGGFVRGDKGDVMNIGAYLAKNGIVGVMPNYRFAPDDMWPSGAQDLAGVIAWLHGTDSHGGDAQKIVVAGNSAGSIHAADYVFREDLQVENDGVIGAVLISTPTVDLTAREVDPKRDALYYGTDGDRAAQSVVNAVEGRAIPVMVDYAQYEPDVIIDQTHLLIEALTKRDGRMPLIASAPGHNHISIVGHIGTGDETLGDDIVQFVKYVAMGLGN